MGFKYLRFCAFSAAVVATQVVSVHLVWVLFACRNALEYVWPEAQAAAAHRNQLPSDQMRALNVRIAATWMHDGGPGIFETSQEETQATFLCSGHGTDDGLLATEKWAPHARSMGEYGSQATTPQPLNADVPIRKKQSGSGNRQGGFLIELKESVTEIFAREKANCAAGGILSCRAKRVCI